HVISPLARPGSERRRFRLAVMGLVIFVLLTAAALTGAQKAPGMWAGAMVLVTWGLLGLTTVGALCGQRRRRATCLGATLFGTGYMLMVAGLPVALVTSVYRQPWPQFATNRLLNAA